MEHFKLASSKNKRKNRKHRGTEKWPFLNSRTFTGKKTYQYKITLHTNGFQRKKTKIYAFPDRSEGEYVFVQPLRWEKIEDADGYIIYGVQPHNHDDVRK